MRALLALAAALALLLGLAAPAAGAAEPRASLPDVEDEVMCVQCGTALNISESPVADQERAFIRDQIAQGRTKEEIKAALVEEYGPRVLATPAAGEGVNLAAYLVPPLLGALGLLAVGLTARRWRRARGFEVPARREADLPPEDARRLDAELTAFDR